MLVDTVKWDILKCFSAFVAFSLSWKMKLEGHHLKTDCPVTVCVLGVISDL